MSIENHPNLHAVGLLTDVLEALESRVRGRGIAVLKKYREPLCEKVRIFVDELDEALDKLAEDTTLEVINEHS